MNDTEGRELMRTRSIAVAVQKKKTLVGHKLLQVLPALVLACLGFQVAAADARGVMYELDIPAQSLNDALQALALASQHKLLYSSELVDGKRSPGVKGEFTAEEAVRRLLTGTGLGFEVGEGLVLIRGRDSRASGALDEKKGLMRVAQGDTQAGQGADEASGSESASEGVKLEEIVVTAQKREERLQDVPMSLTAITSDTIEKRGFVNSEDYLRHIPGVSQIGENANQNIIIRGIETSAGGNNFRSGPTSATYFGETPTTSSSGLQGGSATDIKLIDIDRVEVLRGPQGTAFGNSALGGAVRIIPAAPKLDGFDAKMSAEYSSTARFGGNNYDVDAVLNVPVIADKLAVRAVGYKFEKSGYYRNVAASNAAYRAAVIEPYGAEAFLPDQGRVGDQDIWGARLSLLAAPTDELRLSVNYLKQETEIDGRPAANIGDYEQVSVAVPVAARLRGKPYTVQDSQMEIWNGKAEYNFGWSDLVATYSHVKGGAQANSDFYALPAPFTSRGTQSGDMAEVRLATKLSGAISALAGVYYEDLKDASSAGFYWAGDPALGFFNYLGSFLDEAALLMGARADNRRLKQKAAFGEVTWELTDEFALTGGARFYNYERRFIEVAQGQFYGTGINNDNSQDVSGESVKLNGSYKPNENTHLYVGWAEGFRLGIPQPTLPSICDGDGDGLVDGVGVPLGSSVKADTVDSYEAGGKFRFLNQRLQLDASLFRVDWTDIPLGVTATTCSLGTTLNVGKAKSEGFEAQLSFHMTDALRLDVGGSLTKAQVLQDFAPAALTKGDRLPGSPKYNASLGLEYGFQVLNSEAFIRADAAYVGGFDTLIGAEPRIFGRETFKAGDYTLVDLAAGIDFDRLRFTVFAKNLTNDDSFTIRFRDWVPFNFNPPSQQLQPRTVGVRVAYSFE